MPADGFPQLLSRYMRRIRASAADVGAEIGLSRESVNNWRNGDAQPARKARDKVNLEIDLLARYVERLGSA